jgi:RNA polymerase sigma-32 factor
MAVGQVLRASRAVGYLSREEEDGLVRRMVQGDQRARDRIVLAHMRLVMGTARRFKRYGLEHDDVVSAGTVGMLEAANRFDPDLGFRFATYARLWIKACMQAYIMDNMSMVRRPTSSAAKSLFFSAGAFTFLIGTGTAEERHQAVEKLAEKLGLSRGYIETWLANAGGDRSLDHRYGDEPDGPSLGDFLADPSASAEDMIEAAQEREEMRRALAVLKERERSIISMRWLSDTALPVPMSEVGAEHGISKERVRQIEEAALIKMRRVVATA